MANKSQTAEVSNSANSTTGWKKFFSPEKGSIWWASLWVLKWIVFLPFTLLYYSITGGIWMFRAGFRRVVWDEFGSYIWGQVKYNEDGSVKWVRFVSYSDMVHFHYCIWIFAIFSAVVAVAPTSGQYLAPLLVLVPIFCWVVVTFDFPFDRVWKPAVMSAILLPLADYGLFKGTEFLTTNTYPWLEENVGWLGITSEMAGGYEVLWFLEWAFNRFGFSASSGLFLFGSIAWSVFFLGTVASAWVNHRYELDRRELYRRKLFKSAGRRPVYMRRMTVIVKDLAETIPFGFASLFIEFAKRPLTLKNVLGLAWGKRRKAVEEIINFSSAADHKEAAKRSASEDDAELVDTFSKEEAALDDDHDDADHHDDLGDNEVDDDFEDDDFDAALDQEMDDDL